MLYFIYFQKTYHSSLVQIYQEMPNTTTQLYTKKKKYERANDATALRPQLLQTHAQLLSYSSPIRSSVVPLFTASQKHI